MRLWIDAQLSPALAKWITENFANIEATAARDLGLRDAEDPVIFFSAQKADAVVMTKDSENNTARRQRSSGLLAAILPMQD